MQNPIQKFRQSYIVFEKPGILSKNFENFRELQLPYSSIFFAETLRTNLYKRVCGIFLFCLDLELFAKIKKDLVSTPSFYTLVKITDYLNKTKKTLHNLLYTLLSIKRVQNFNKKY